LECATFITEDIIGACHLFSAGSIREDRISIVPPSHDPEQQQALQEHIQAIAKILYEDTSAEQLTTLAGIEQAVRNKCRNSHA